MSKLKPREFVTPERRREIESEIRVLEQQIGGGNSSNGVGFMKHAVNQVSNPEDIQREITKKKQTLKDGTPKPFATSAQANTAFQWAKKAEKWINQHRPENVSVRYPEPGRAEHDFDRGVNEMVDWMKKGKKVYSQYRYIMQRLDPKNPDAGKIRGL